MRRKSERNPGKKAKASPEKKVEKIEKPKRTRSRRKKQSTSSENESAEDANASPVPEVQPAPVPEENPPKTPVKEESPEESQDQVWRVKAAEGSGDTGEIQKLKICLTRPPTTPERVDRSPRSKRKHSRATSSSDTPSVEAPEDKRKSKHRAKRSHRGSKDESEKTQDSQEDEPESDTKTGQEPEKSSNEATQSEADGKVDSSENTISTNNEGNKSNEKASEKVDSTEDASKNDEVTTEQSAKEDKTSDADTTVVSPKAETTVVSATSEPRTPTTSETQEQPDDKTPEPESPTRRRSASVDKSEILELHPEESKVESDIEADKSKGNTDDKGNTKEMDKAKEEHKVSKIQDKSPIEEPMSDSDKSTNKTGVVDSSKSEKRSRNNSTDSGKDQNQEKTNGKSSNEVDKRKSFERSDSVHSNQEEPHHNGQAAPFVVSRKRRWGSRPSKITKQKSITISTDVLKDIIPNVKPVEFEEVIEDKKHKRVVSEKIERPVLPKIIIDNSENVKRAEQERNSDRKDQDDKVIAKARDMASSRKISIIKDNDSIITRPPSPPRNKQSCVLYITNLVRPFTLPQLKNLLQRTGRLVENGFWIDRIKSKCFVIYETEDQAVETRHALHGVTWPVSNPKTLQVDFSTQEAFDKAKTNEDTDNAQVSTIPGTVEDWLREQDMKRERGEMEKPWERKLATREWDLGKNDKDKDKDRLRRDERPLLDKRRHRTPERSPEPARKFKKKEEEAPAKLLDDLFKKTKTTPCIYWLPLSDETIAVKEEQRRQHMAEHERRMLEQRRPHRRH